MQSLADKEKKISLDNRKKANKNKIIGITICNIKAGKKMEKDLRI